MKKLLLLAAGTMMAFTASAQWAVVGGYCDWSFQSAVTFTGEGDNLSCKIDELTSGFKIVDITNNNWDIQYGTAEKIVPNQQYTLDGKNGGPDPANIEFGGGVLSVKNATVNWNPSTAAFEIIASESDIDAGYPTLYATGSFNGWPSPQDSQYKGEIDGGIYTFVIDLGNSGNVSFKLATSGWGLEVAAPTQGVVVGYEPVQVSIGGSDLNTTLTGEQTLKLDYDNLTLWFVGEGEIPAPEKPAAPENLYLLGNVEGNSWNPETAIPADSTKDGVFTFNEIKLNNSDEDTAWFTFINILTNDWDVINDGSHRYGAAAGVNNALTAGSTTAFTITGDATWSIPNGTYDFVVDFNSMELTVTISEGTGAVDSLVNSNSEAVYYNLQGVKVNNPVKGGIYVVKQGNKTSKVVIR